VVLVDGVPVKDVQATEAVYATDQMVCVCVVRIGKLNVLVVDTRLVDVDTLDRALVVEEVWVVEVYVVELSVDVEVKVEILVNVVLYSVDGTVRVLGTVVVDVMVVVVGAVDDRVRVVVVVAGVVNTLFRINEIV
jgi:hypothetical protein